MIIVFNRTNGLPVGIPLDNIGHIHPDQFGMSGDVSTLKTRCGTSYQIQLRFQELVDYINSYYNLGDA